MPKRTDPNVVKADYKRLGYRLPKGFVYKNNKERVEVYDLNDKKYKLISYQLVKQQINRDHKKEYVYKPKSMFTNKRLMNIGLSDKEVVHKDSFQRWLDKQGEEIQSMPKDLQKVSYNSMKDNVKLFRMQKDFMFEFGDQYVGPNKLAGFIEAAKIVLPQLNNVNIRLTLTDSFGNPSYRFLNASTINYMDQFFRNPDMDRIKDSSEDMIDSWFDIQTISVEFVKKGKGKSKTGGFFPFINVSDIDLTRYGIYTSLDDPSINDSCLLHAFTQSKILSDNEIELLKSFITTRMIPQTQLKDISNTFHIHITVKKIYEQTGKSSFDEYGVEFKDNRTINLIVVYDHYMLNETVDVSTFYIKHWKEIEQDPRFVNHNRKRMLKKFNDKRYEFVKEGLNISKLTKVMIENGLLIHMNDDQINKLEWSFKPTIKCISQGLTRKVQVNDKHQSTYKRLHRVNQTKHFFGYKPDEGEIDGRLNELQKVINSLHLRKHVDVSLYYKFSELMQKIMFEYGCYDNVYELSGTTAQSIRNECIFPKHDSPAFYSNEKMYYIDLNGAYMSCVKGIPTTKDANGPLNTKIKDLIKTLYEARLKAKRQGKHKLAITLKFLMSSCWGYSIKRQKIIKHKYTSNVDEYVETFAPFVLKWTYNKDGRSGFVDTINSFVPHFTIPHFAKSVLDTFNEKMNEVKSLVNVHYQNVDAILISESDYNKLVNLGYVGDQLGQFKIEHIFTEFALKNGKQYVSTLENGERFYHCVKKDIDYDSFVNEVKNNI